MDCPPLMLCTQRASRVRRSPLPKIIIKPGAEQPSVASEFAHHASHGDFAFPGNSPIPIRASFVPRSGLPKLRSLSITVRQKVIGVAPFMVMTRQDHAIPTQPSARAIRVATQTKDAFENPLCRTIAQVILLLYPSTTLCRIKVKIWAVGTHACCFVKW